MALAIRLTIFIIQSNHRCCWSHHIPSTVKSTRNLRKKRRKKIVRSAISIIRRSDIEGNRVLKTRQWWWMMKTAASWWMKALSYTTQRCQHHQRSPQIPSQSRWFWCKSSLRFTRHCRTFRVLSTNRKRLSVITIARQWLHHQWTQEQENLELAFWS